MRATIAITICIMSCSCAVLRPQPDWTVRWPTDRASPWNRTVDVAFSNATLQQVVAQLEGLANAQPGPKLSLGCPQDPFASPALITFTATNIPVVEAFRIAGDIVNYQAMFRGLDGILAEHCHGQHEMTVFLTGRCVDAATGKPIKSISIAKYIDEIEVKESGEFLHPIQVEGTTDFVRCDDKNYLMKTEPIPQNIRFMVTAPGYQPREFVISTHGSLLTYTNNIEMKKDIPTTDGTVRR